MLLETRQINTLFATSCFLFSLQVVLAVYLLDNILTLGYNPVVVAVLMLIIVAATTRYHLRMRARFFDRPSARGDNTQSAQPPLATAIAGDGPSCRNGLLSQRPSPVLDTAGGDRAVRGCTLLPRGTEISSHPSRGLNQVW